MEKIDWTTRRDPDDAMFNIVYALFFGVVVGGGIGWFFGFLMGYAWGVK